MDKDLDSILSLVVSKDNDRTFDIEQLKQSNPELLTSNNGIKKIEMIPIIVNAMKELNTKINIVEALLKQVINEDSACIQTKISSLESLLKQL